MTDTDKYQIEINAQPQFLPDESDPDEDRYAFSYTIRIRNGGPIVVQLISRHWIISDAHNRTQEVRGLGVVGQQPLLRPGEEFEYTSSCILPTPVGTMRGSYQMVANDGQNFSVLIPEFVLALPHALH